MKQLEGFLVQGKEDHVCLLKKSLYGLKQSLQQWYKRRGSFILGHGYSRSDYDSCVYHMLLASKSISNINKLMSQPSGKFEMKNLGGAKKILGMEIHRD